MDFKDHPILDRSQASDWFDLSDDLAPLTVELKPFAKLVEVYLEHREHLEEKVLNRIRLHAADDRASKPHVVRNEILFAPVGNHGFQVYFQFFFLERMDQASADSDFWWGIILCPDVFEQRLNLSDVKHWNVIQFGWAVQ